MSIRETADSAIERAARMGDEDAQRHIRYQRIREADEYLAHRTGAYHLRCERYDATLQALHVHELRHGHTVVDVGSGWGEFGVRLHTGSEFFKGTRARYIPVDACVDGVDLDTWVPPRRAEFFVCLEVLEHLDHPERLLREMMAAADRAVVVSTPNPETTDVMGMDRTHRTPITRALLEGLDFNVSERQFYGKPADSLFGVWAREMERQR
jgi:2-polyprenyl-3-methyl-5-hydroxy-6-metoxy-1,4-benzoquinol methylase